MPNSHRQRPRQLKPELEHEYARSTSLGYESAEDAGFIRCLAHGFPTPLARWHCHDEYELHLITETSGKVFVGDWIGQFQPGQVVLTGPRLPHNWVSMDLPQEGVAIRDLVIQFSHQPLVDAANAIPELGAILPMLDRAKHGIEFFGLEDWAPQAWEKVKTNKGLARFIAFCEFLNGLAECDDFRLLSSVQLQGDDPTETDSINDLLNRITADLSAQQSVASVAQELGMSESRFSRFFKKATGNTFTDFVNRIRINRACQLLMETDQLVTQICYDVGFNNVANFNRRFLEIKGMTPSDFRKRAQARFQGSTG